MKKFLISIVSFLVIMPSIASAQMTVVQGGTGTSSVPTNYVVIGNSALHLTAVATSSLGLPFGSGVIGNCVDWTSGNNLGDAGAACGSGSGIGGVATSSLLATYPIKATVTSASINFSLLNMATTTATCAGTVSCSQFTIIGLSPVTITGSGGSGGSGNVSTSTHETAGGIAYWTSNSATPALLGEVATSTLTPSSPLTGSFVQLGSSGSLGCQTASGSQAGCLSSTDWTTFNNKGSGTVTSVGAVYPLSSTGGTTPVISSATSSGSSAGVLSAADWTTFNGKQANLSLFAGTYSNGDVCTYASSGTLLNCNTALPTGTVTSVTASAPLFSSGGTTPNITWTGIATTSNLTAGQLLESAGGAGVFSVATSSLGVTSPITFSGTLGAQIGGTGGNFACATCNTSNATVSSVGLSSTNSTLTIGSTPVTTSGTITADINLTHANNWTGLQQFANASSSQFSAYTAYFGGTATSSFSNAGALTVVNAANAITIPFLGTAAGTFIAADPSGHLIATTTPTGGSSGAVSIPVQLATTGALPANTYAGGVLTEVGTGALTVDGTSAAVGNRILVKNEAAQTNNGIYSVTAAGSGIAAYVLTRVSDYNSSSNVIPGEATYVIGGATLNDDWWALTTVAPITVGGGGSGSNLTYVETSAAASGVTQVSGTWPILSSGGTTPVISWGGISTSTQLLTNQVLFASAANTMAGNASFTFNPTGTLLTITNASSTSFSANDICLNGTCKSAWPTGTVSSIVAGTGLTGGTITTTGTIGQANWISTSTAETATYIPVWSSTNGTPAALTGGTSAFKFTTTGNLLTVTNASTTNFTAGSSNPFNIYANGEAVAYDGLTGNVGQVSPMRYLSFQLSTSTAWTASSSASSVYGDEAQVIMPFAGTMRTLACATNAGTLEIEASVNSNNEYYPASTTAGTYTYSNTFTKGQIMDVIGGAPASSPAIIPCTLGAVQSQ